MALGGLMSLLKDVAVSPVGQIAGGVMEQKVTDWQEEARIKKENDERNAQFTDAVTLKGIDNMTSQELLATQKYGAYNHIIDAGVPKYVADELWAGGFFDKAQNSPEGVYNVLAEAESAYGVDFWRDKTNKAHQDMLARSQEGQEMYGYNVEAQYKKGVTDRQTYINNALSSYGSIPKNTATLVTTPNVGVQEGVQPVSVDTTPDKVPLDLTKYYPGPELVGVDAEETQKRMALANEDFLQNMGYKNISSFFTTDTLGNRIFKWDDLEKQTPGVIKDRTLFQTAVGNVWSTLEAGRGEEFGFGNLQNQFGSGGALDDAGLVHTIGRVVANVIKDTEKEGQANWFLDKIRKNIEKNAKAGSTMEVMMPTSNAEMIKTLESYNPSWLDELISIQGKDKEILEGYIGGTAKEWENPFINTPYEYIFSDSKNIPIIIDPVEGLGDSAERSIMLDEIGQRYQDKILYNKKDPLTYNRIQMLHNYYRGERATKTIESGRAYEPDVSEKMPIPPGIQTARTYSPRPSSAFLQGVTPSGIMADVKSISALDDIINFKRNNIFNLEEYRPIEGLGDTASVLLHGTDLNSLGALKTLESRLHTIPEFQRELQLLLRQQQQDGRLPKDLTQEDIEILADRIIDDYAYAINEVQLQMRSRADAPTDKALPGLDEKEFIDSDAETPPSKVEEDGEKGQREKNEEALLEFIGEKFKNIFRPTEARAEEPPARFKKE